MLLEVGRIDKAHGVMGEVVVTLLTDRAERVAPGATFHSDAGEFTVESSRSHQHRFIVHFAGVRDRGAADALRGTVLHAEPIDDPDTLWVHELVGASVVDLSGTGLGVVDSVEANPASDLLVLDNEALVPLTFFVEQRDDGVIVVDPPDGLFDPIDASGPS